MAESFKATVCPRIAPGFLHCQPKLRTIREARVTMLTALKMINLLMLYDGHHRCVERICSRGNFSLYQCFQTPAMVRKANSHFFLLDLPVNSLGTFYSAQ